MQLYIVKPGKRLHWPRAVIEQLEVPERYGNRRSGYFDEVARRELPEGVRGGEGYVIDADVPAESALCKDQWKKLTKVEGAGLEKPPTKANAIDAPHAVRYLRGLDPVAIAGMKLTGPGATKADAPFSLTSKS